MSDRLNRSQQRAVDRVIAYYREHVVAHDPKAYEITTEIKRFSVEFNMISLSVRCERTDCEYGSPRHALCGDGGHFTIHRRGGIVVNASYAMVGRESKAEHLKHIAFMVGGSVSKY